MFVNIGLQNGVLLRTVLDPLNGQLTDTRTRSVLVVAQLVSFLTFPTTVSWGRAPSSSFGSKYKKIPPSLHSHHGHGLITRIKTSCTLPL